jgi:hypothetical protein
MATDQNVILQKLRQVTLPSLNDVKIKLERFVLLQCLIERRKHGISFNASEKKESSVVASRISQTVPSGDVVPCEVGADVGAIVSLPVVEVSLGDIIVLALALEIAPFEILVALLLKILEAGGNAFGEVPLSLLLAIVVGGIVLVAVVGVLVGTEVPK